MKAEIQGDILLITLSRRNVMTLLHKLDTWPDSAKAIECGEPIYPDRCTMKVRVAIQEDNEHYQGRLPGIMHPRTELGLMTRIGRGEQE